MQTESEKETQTSQTESEKDENVNIIVIGYRVPKLESQCLKSIIHNTKHPYILTFFDNFKSGLSLTQAWNRFIDVSPCSYICLLNNDTEVSPLWLSRLMNCFECIPGAGLVGPSTNNCHGIQSGIKSVEAAAEHANELEIVSDPLSGFCLLFKRDTWSELGGFDERYEFYGAESMFVYRINHELGLKSIWRKDVFIYHHGEASSKAHGLDASAEREKAKRMYWNDVAKLRKAL